MDDVSNKQAPSSEMLLIENTCRSCLSIMSRIGSERFSADKGGFTDLGAHSRKNGGSALQRGAPLTSCSTPLPANNTTLINMYTQTHTRSSGAILLKVMGEEKSLICFHPPPADAL